MCIRDSLYTNDLYVSGTTYGITVDRSNYASASDPGTGRTYSPTGFETSGYLYVTGSSIIGSAGSNTHQITGSLEVSGPAHFTDEVHAEGIFCVDSHTRLGNGPTDVVTFYNTITGSQDNSSNLQSSVFASHLYTWALNTSGSSILGSAAADTHRVTGSLEVSTNTLTNKLYVGSHILHLEDAGASDTGVLFSDDQVDIYAGNVYMLGAIEDGTQDNVIINPGNADVDFIVDGDTSEKVFHVEARSAGDDGAGNLSLIHI